MAETPMSALGGDLNRSTQHTEQWVSDAVTGGLNIALESPDNIPKVLFQGAVWLLGTSELLDAAADGANVSYTFQPKENVDCGIIVFYPQTGVVETYNAIQNRNLWIGVQEGPRYGGDRRLKGTPISMV